MAAIALFPGVCLTAFNYLLALDSRDTAQEGGLLNPPSKAKVTVAYLLMKVQICNTTRKRSLPHGRRTALDRTEAQPPIGELWLSASV